MAWWWGWCPLQHPHPRLYLLPPEQSCPLHVAESISPCLLMPCSSADAEVCTTMSTCKGTGLGVSSGVMEAGSSWGFTPGAQEGPLPCRESGISFSLVSAGQAQACSRKSSKYLCFSVGQFYGKKVNSFLCLQLFYYAALMKNTLECLKKAYGKELLNGINHFKLSNYPLDFFFFKTPAG